MTTDLTLSPSDIIEIYGYRFKIEVSFKQILRIIGGYSYHFWMKRMVPTKRNSGDTYLHRKDKKYRKCRKERNKCMPSLHADSNYCPGINDVSRTVLPAICMAKFWIMDAYNECRCVTIWICYLNCPEKYVLWVCFFKQIFYCNTSIWYGLCC